jgi:hypothetical protein
MTGLTKEQYEKLEPAGVAPLSIENPPAMLAWALHNNAPMDMLERLLALNERWEANQARKAYQAAMSKARAEIKPIEKNIEVAFEGRGPGARQSRRHEDLSAIAKGVDEILAKHGLFYSWRTRSEPGQPIFVTCIMSHEDGHQEENTLAGAPDNSGSKNSIQAIGSTCTYLERYTLKALLGLSATLADDDGAGAVPMDTINSDQIIELQTRLSQGKSLKLFLEKYQIDELWKLPTSKYEEAKKAIEDRENEKRKRQAEKAPANE